MSIKTFKGRVVSGGEVSAKTVVSHVGFNTLASFQGALQFGDKSAKCEDQNNKDLYKKPLCKKALYSGSLFLDNIFHILSETLLKCA